MGVDIEHFIEVPYYLSIAEWKKADKILWKWLTRWYGDTEEYKEWMFILPLCVRHAGSTRQVITDDTVEFRAWIPGTSFYRYPMCYGYTGSPTPYILAIMDFINMYFNEVKQFFTNDGWALDSGLGNEAYFDIDPFTADDMRDLYQNWLKASIEEFKEKEATE